MFLLLKVYSAVLLSLHIRVTWYIVSYKVIKLVAEGNKWNKISVLMLVAALFFDCMGIETF